MKNILTIDVDFIAEKYLDVLSELVGGKITENYWNTILDVSGVESTKIVENKHNVMFIIKYFLQSIKKTNNVVFGYYHDSILNHIDVKSDEKLFIVNIDHHHDISYSQKLSVQGLNYGECSESNWLVPIENKIEKYVWIKNKNSQIFDGQTPYLFDIHDYQDAPRYNNVDWDLIYVLFLAVFQ